MFGKLAPVGNQISLKKSAPVNWQQQYPGYSAQLYGSGTMALAVAMQLAIKQVSCTRGVKCPEVILPAYGCPDLISAAVFAGLKPVLVDLEADSPNYSLPLLQDTLNKNTVAVVAVNLLGIPDKLEKIRAITQAFDCLLIEDNAQCYPVPGQPLWGDFMITSFGRGKPVGLLGGGLLLVRDELDLGVEASAIEPSAEIVECCKWLLYNLLITPLMYGVVANIPGLALGKTEYKPLVGIEGIPSSTYCRLKSNINKYLAACQKKEPLFSEGLAGLGQYVIDLSLEHRSAIEAPHRLLRVPILVRQQADRDPLVSMMQTNGLGATSFYGLALHEISSVTARVEVRHPCTEASSFASRLITLTNHDFVKSRHVDGIFSAFDNFFSQKLL